MTVAILVVDDEPDVAELSSQRFRREVRREHCALHFAGTGKEALDLKARLVARRDPDFEESLRVVVQLAKP
jgi:CheY-like chemotaxis protein